MGERPVSFRLDVRDEKTSRELESIILSTVGFQDQKSGDADYCDLLICDIADDPEKTFQFVRSVQQSGFVGEVFLTSRDVNPEVLIEALRAGIKEFIPQPVRKQDVLNALTRFRQRAAGRTKEGVKTDGQKGKIIAVLGSKGGVGTTTVAVNLATSLIDLEGGDSVLLIDMNPLFGDMPVFLGMESPLFSWLEIIKNISRVDAVYLMSILHKHPTGIHVLPAPAGLPDEPLTPDLISTLFRLMQSMFDFIIIDSGKSLGSASRAVIGSAHTVLLVCNLNLPCLINLRKLRDTVAKLDFAGSSIEIIGNRYQSGSHISLGDAEETLSKKILATIPNDYGLAMSAVNQGKALSQLAYGAGITKSFRQLASLLTGRGEKKKEKSRIFRLKSA
jgi:pilus assembly protein CpaE